MAKAGFSLIVFYHRAKAAVQKKRN